MSVLLYSFGEYNYLFGTYTIICCCVSNYLISDLKDHFTAKIPDSSSGQFTSGSARLLKRQLVDCAHGPIQSSKPIDLTKFEVFYSKYSSVQFISYLKAPFLKKF